MISDEERGDITADLSGKVVAKLRREFTLVAQEVRVDSRHRVDFVAFSPGAGGRNCALEHGKFVFVEVKSCMEDFKSGHGLTFLGDENWLVCPRDLADELHDRQSLPPRVQVYCPDKGGALRLAYDLRIHDGLSLRDDSTLCLLWAMLVGSYSLRRTTRSVFSDRYEEVDDDYMALVDRRRAPCSIACGRHCDGRAHA